MHHTYSLLPTFKCYLIQIFITFFYLKLTFAANFFAKLHYVKLLVRNLCLTDLPHKTHRTKRNSIQLGDSHSLSPKTYKCTAWQDESKRYFKRCSATCNTAKNTHCDIPVFVLDFFFWPCCLPFKGLKVGLEEVLSPSHTINAFCAHIQHWHDVALSCVSTRCGDLCHGKKKFQNHILRKYNIISPFLAEINFSPIVTYSMRRG